MTEHGRSFGNLWAGRVRSPRRSSASKCPQGGVLGAELRSGSAPVVHGFGLAGDPVRMIAACAARRHGLGNIRIASDSLAVGSDGPAQSVGQQRGLGERRSMDGKPGIGGASSASPAICTAAIAAAPRAR